jgi:1,4-alpha-glucan branching enzyme
MQIDEIDSEEVLSPSVHTCHFLHFHLGVIPFTHEGLLFAKAAVYAPNVDYVAIVGDFNDWNPSKNPLQKNANSNVWSATLQKIKSGDCYKFYLRKGNNFLLKADPFARQSELRPNDASVIPSPHSYTWNDEEWMNTRKNKSPSINRESPLLILEIHLSSWRKSAHGFLNYRELAHDIAEYAIAMEYTHIELLPITEHLVDESMGYQVTGYFSPTARHGTANDLKYFIDHLHQKGIGVILDWVPAHFSKDPAGLSNFILQPLFEPEQFSYRKNWGTQIFDFDKKWVRNFLISNAIYWLKEFHFDGIRVDAVSALLYKDYLREDDEWDTSTDDNTINFSAVDFIKELTSSCKRLFPDAILIAEESTAWPKITEPVNTGGLGFDYTWNLGWINDTKHYFSLTDDKKKDQKKLISFSGIYLFNEKYIHSLSHDELDPTTNGLYGLTPSNLARSLKRKKAALFLFYLYFLPGAKLLLAGSDMGIMESWHPLYPIDYHEADVGFISFIRSLNLINKDPDLVLSNHDRDYFKWNDCFKKNEHCISFTRQGKTKTFVVIINFSSSTIDYELNDINGSYDCVLSSLDENFPSKVDHTQTLSLSPYSGVVYVKEQKSQ